MAHETKYGVGTIRNLSSGCKTLLNIMMNPNMVVNIDECGKNVLDIIFKMENISIYITAFLRNITSVFTALLRIKDNTTSYSQLTLTNNKFRFNNSLQIFCWFLLFFRIN